MSNTYLDYESQNGVMIITLKRSESLNALNFDMVLSLTDLLNQAKDDPSVYVIILKSNTEKAFCAGGDILEVYYDLEKGNKERAREYITREYAMNRLMSDFPKPIIAYGQGIAFGGGMGLLMHSHYRVATTTSLWSMPETAIGFFPDVAAAKFMNNCPGFTGFYMAVTGYRATVEDVVYARFSTHFMSPEVFDMYVDGLKQAPLEVDVVGVSGLLADTLSQEVGFENSYLFKYKEEIDRCFSHKSLKRVVEEIEEILISDPKGSSGKWAKDTLKLMDKNSPYSMVLTHSYLHSYRFKFLSEVFDRDLKLALLFMDNPHDFLEGVSCKLIHRDRQPCWSHASIQEVDEQAIYSILNN